jgi:hypothetical protein
MNDAVAADERDESAALPATHASRQMTATTGRMTREKTDMKTPTEHGRLWPDPGMSIGYRARNGNHPEG